jgi:hypothetical protein
MTALFHGGIPDLRVGDVIEPGHARRSHDGCPWCAARERGEAHLGIDGPSLRQDRVYVTPHRLYAKFYASLWGRGDLYRVEPIGELERSIEDTVETFMAPTVQVAAVLDRVVLLTDTERRRLIREWSVADAAELAGGQS